MGLISIYHHIKAYLLYRETPCSQAAKGRKRRVEGELPYLEVRLGELRITHCYASANFLSLITMPRRIAYHDMPYRQVCHCTSCGRQGAEQVLLMFRHLGELFITNYYASANCVSLITMPRRRAGTVDVPSPRR